MNFQNIAGTVRNDDHFAGRVEYCLYVAAVNIMAEVNTTPSHAARVTYATKVLSGQASIRSAELAVLTNPTIASAVDSSSVPDGDIQFAVNSLFNALAGVAT
jgi:hypothetical protein